jgi:hypothetical protein
MIDYNKRQQDPIMANLGTPPPVKPQPFRPTVSATDRNVRRIVEAIRDYQQFDREIRDAKRAAASDRIRTDTKGPVRAPYNERAAAAADVVDYTRRMLGDLGIEVPS